MGVVFLAIRQRSLWARLASAGAIFCVVAGLLAAASVSASASELCAHTKNGSPSGPLFLRDACKKGELELGIFDGQRWTLGAPAAHVGVTADSGASALSVGDGETIQETQSYEATTDPAGTADIVGDTVEEGSVDHGDITLMARTTDGRAFVIHEQFTASRLLGSSDIQLSSTVDQQTGTIDPPPSAQVAQVGNRWILQVMGNPADLIFWNVNFIKFQARSKQSEAKANLKALYIALKAYFQEKDTYSSFVGEIGFAPERNNRYRYVLTANPVSLQDRSGVFAVQHSTDQGVSEDVFKYGPLGATVTQGPCAGSDPWGVVTGPSGSFTVAAYGNIDADGTLDIWTISDQARVLSGPNCDAVGNVAAGEPANEQNDVNR
jgi:type IV pilus assembly protein PilA